MNKEDIEFEKLVDEVKTQREKFKKLRDNPFGRFKSPGIYTREFDISIMPPTNGIHKIEHEVTILPTGSTFEDFYTDDEA